MLWSCDKVTSSFLLLLSLFKIYRGDHDILWICFLSRQPLHKQNMYFTECSHIAYMQHIEHIWRALKYTSYICTLKSNSSACREWLKVSMGTATTLPWKHSCSTRHAWSFKILAVQNHIDVLHVWCYLQLSQTLIHVGPTLTSSGFPGSQILGDYLTIPVIELERGHSAWRASLLTLSQ